MKIYNSTSDAPNMPEAETSIEHGVRILRQEIADLRHSLQFSKGAVGERDKRIAELESILLAILAADERGQGQPFAEAMDRAHKAVTQWVPKPRK